MIAALEDASANSFALLDHALWDDQHMVVEDDDTTPLVDSAVIVMADITDASDEFPVDNDSVIDSNAVTILASVFLSTQMEFMN